jgi:hypothetical protein
MHLRSILYVTVCVLTVFSGIGLIAASANAKDEEDTVNTELLFEEATIRADQRDRLGAELHKVLADENASPGDRIRAARLLGRLQYLPAIPTIIRYADLSPLLGGLSRPRVGHALKDYGDAAVPQIVEAVLQENRSLISGGVQSGRSLLTFYLALRSGGTMETARTYALGIAATRQDDADLVEKVDTFVRRLERYLSEKRRK